jgi:hypothetical protein
MCCVGTEWNITRLDGTRTRLEQDFSALGGEESWRVWRGGRRQRGREEGR